jgi:hypothetical protein
MTTHSLIIFTATLAVPVGIMLSLISLEMGAGRESRGYRKATQRRRAYALLARGRDARSSWQKRRRRGRGKPRLRA